MQRQKPYIKWRKKPIATTYCGFPAFQGQSGLLGAVKKLRWQDGSGILASGKARRRSIAKASVTEEQRSQRPKVQARLLPLFIDGSLAEVVHRHQHPDDEHKKRGAARLIR